MEKLPFLCLIAYDLTDNREETQKLIMWIKNWLFQVLAAFVLCEVI